MPNTEDLFDPENLELALMLLPQDAFDKMTEPRMVENEDGTWNTGDPFFDALEQALARGESINDVITRLNTT